MIRFIKTIPSWIRLLRAIVYVGIKNPEKRELFLLRLYTHHVGFTGVITDVDRAYANEHDVIDVSRFSVWMCRSIVEYEKDIRYSEYLESDEGIIDGFSNR